MASILKGIQKNAIDWGFVLANCGSSMKKPITDTITRNEELLRLVQEAKTDRPRLSFDHYKRLLQSDPEGSAFVESCQKSSQSFIPSTSDGSSSKQQLSDIQKEHETLTLQTNTFLEQLQVKIQETKQQLGKFSTITNVDDVTLYDLQEIYPDVKAECDEKIRQGFWSIDYSLADLEAAVKQSKGHDHH